MPPETKTIRNRLRYAGLFYHGIKQSSSSAKNGKTFAKNGKSLQMAVFQIL
jgi:hypothetical protein